MQRLAIYSIWAGIWSRLSTIGILGKVRSQNGVGRLFEIGWQIQAVSISLVANTQRTHATGSIPDPGSLTLITGTGEFFRKTGPGSRFRCG